MSHSVDLIRPDWPAPVHVRACMTTRVGGVSRAPWASFNLGDHVGDDPAHVAANRAQLGALLPAEPAWLTQVHGTRVVELGCDTDYRADACVARAAGRVCAVLTADCLPVLLCDRAGRVVAAAHAGWRGLAAGVLEATVAAMRVPPGEILAWMGAAIGPRAFEVGDEVRAAFVAQHAAAASAFVSHAPGKWLADLYALARLRLGAVGVHAVHGGARCTFGEADAFFSYRRDGVTGRMAALTWLERAA